MTRPLRLCLLSLLTLLAVAGTGGCRCQPAKPAALPQPAAVAALVALVAPADLFAGATVTGQEPKAEVSLRAVVAALRTEVRQPKMGRVVEYLTEYSRQQLLPDPTRPLLAPLPTVADRLEPAIGQVAFGGGRAAMVVRKSGMPLTSWFYLRQGRWLWDLADARPYEPAWLGPPDRDNHPITLDQALQGVPGTGPATLVFATSAGTFRCVLYADQVPELAANLIGLATGRRASRKTLERTITQQWQFVPFYAGTVVHRALPGRMLEGGDPFGLGTGHAGYRVADQLDMALRHDRPGVLSMATIGPNSASCIWRIDLQPAPDRDDRDPVVGQCQELAVLQAMSRMPENSVVVQSVTVQR